MAHLPAPLRSRRAFVDSSAYLALLDRADRNFRTAIGILDGLASERYRLYTTNAMLIEAHALILSVLGNHVANRFLRTMTTSHTVVVRVRAADEARAQEILYRYEDKVFSYNDAISFAVMERLGIDLAFTFDSDFRQFGWRIASLPV